MTTELAARSDAMPPDDEDLAVSLADDRGVSRKARDVLDLRTPYTPTSHEARGTRTGGPNNRQSYGSTKGRVASLRLCRTTRMKRSGEPP